MKQAKLVHIAVRSEEPCSLADFYKSTFGLKEVLSNRRAVDLWDGYLFLAINPPSANGPMGLNHFGFVVNDVDSLRPVLSRAGASKIEARPAGRSFTIGAFMIRKVIRSIFHRGGTTQSRRSGCKSNPTIKL